MLNKKDLMVLSCLRQNGRMTLTNLSKKTTVPISTIFDRLKNNHYGTIKKHVALINYSKLGFHTKAYLMIKINKKDKEQIKNYLKCYPYINTLHKINNGYDYLAECIFKNINDLEYFLDNLEDKFSIKSKNVFYVIDPIKEEEFLADPNNIESLN